MGVRWLAVYLVAMPTLSFAAQWEAVSKTNNATVYVDKLSVISAADTRKVWVLFDFTSPTQDEGSQKQFQSKMSMTHLKCSERVFAVSQQTLYTGKMGAGDVLRTSKYPLDFDDVPPDSAAEMIMQRVCPKGDRK